MYEVIYLPVARNDLEAAAMYIATELSAPDAAYEFVDAVDYAVQRLSDMPYRHAIYTPLYAVSREVRFIPVKNYNIFYVADEEAKTVEIQRVLYQRRNVNKI